MRGEQLRYVQRKKAQNWLEKQTEFPVFSYLHFRNFRRSDGVSTFNIRVDMYWPDRGRIEVIDLGSLVIEGEEAPAVVKARLDMLERFQRDPGFRFETPRWRKSLADLAFGALSITKNTAPSWFKGMTIKSNAELSVVMESRRSSATMAVPLMLFKTKDAKAAFYKSQRSGDVHGIAGLVLDAHHDTDEQIARKAWQLLGEARIHIG